MNTQNTVYHTSVEQKRHAQDAAKRKRTVGVQMPRLREMLREKCRKRIIETRKNCTDTNRKIQLSELKEILRLELNEFDQDLELEQLILDELLSDVNEWYALGEQNVETLYEEPDNKQQKVVLCPVCLMKPLQRRKTAYICECSVQFEHSADMEELEILLHKQIACHELQCTQALRFFIEPSSGHLYTMCGSCDYFSSI